MELKVEKVLNGYIVYNNDIKTKKIAVDAEEVSRYITADLSSSLNDLAIDATVSINVEMITGKRRGKNITDSEEDLVCQHYIDNWTLKDIASYANITQATVMAILRRKNIPLRGGRQISPEVEKEVVELYNSGMSIVEITNKTSVRSGQTIYRILRSAKVKMRRNRKN